MCRTRFILLLVFVALACASPVSCSSNGASIGFDCANESSVSPYSDAGVLPLRALPTGRPCANGAVCTATIDNCPNDWPDGAAAPLTSNATPFECDCPDGVWSCAATATTAPSCSIASDAGPADGGSD